MVIAMARGLISEDSGSFFHATSNATGVYVPESILCCLSISLMDPSAQK